MQVARCSCRVQVNKYAKVGPTSLRSTSLVMFASSAAPAQSSSDCGCGSTMAPGSPELNPAKKWSPTSRAKLLSSVCKYRSRASASVALSWRRASSRMLESCRITSSGCRHICAGRSDTKFVGSDPSTLEGKCEASSGTH